jgi:hypothetical protein
MSTKRTVQFDPRKPPYRDTTLARQVARQNLNTLNNAFWVGERAYPVVKTAFSSLTFPTGPTVHGVFGSEQYWIVAVDEQRLWMRQHVLVSAASLLEVYLSTAIAAALWAHPEYADRSLTGIGEVALIKFPERAPGLKRLIQAHVKSMLKGEWSNRFRQMAIVFGKLPAKLDALASRLQSLQDKRNRIAHDFGQTTKVFRRTPWAPMDSIKLEVSDVEESLVCISCVIREADIQLFAPLIGGYEFLYEYHVWLAGQRNPFTRPAPDLLPRYFRKHIGSKFGSVPNQKYFKALVRYYDACS